MSDCPRFESQKSHSEQQTASLSDVLRHRDAVYKAESSRLNGEPMFTPAEVDARINMIFASFATKEK